MTCFRSLTLLFALLSISLRSVAQTPCGNLPTLRLPDVRIDEATDVAATDEPVGDVTAAHCRVTGMIGGTIGFEVLLPVDWNGRFFMGGGGGFVGTIQNAARGTVDQGYATAGTDTGHQDSGLEADWALGDHLAQVNFAHLAIHRTAEVAKSLIHAHYDQDPAYSYFAGCSRGGGQAFMEAQRYPHDFDGIVAGAPAFDWPGIGAEFIQNIQLNFPDPNRLAEPVITAANLELLERELLDACDHLDGVVDGVMEDPRACTFSVDQLPACEAGHPGPDCLTALQRSAIERIYAPVISNGEAMHPGQPFGGEGETVGGWKTWISGLADNIFAGSAQRFPSLQFAFGTEMFKYFVYGDPDWDYSTYDLDRAFSDSRHVARLLNADDPDLSAFRDRGGKLLLWHGWSDTALSAYKSIDYYEEAEALDPGLRDYFRFFLMPGVLHCAGGPGPDQVDWFSAIADWVERGQAPDRIVASKQDAEGNTTRTRPLCPFPQRAVYLGSGSSDDAANFNCEMPD